MNSVRRDPGNFRLDPALYENLRKQILRRDSWRCQSCGTMSNLEVHHKRFRSHSGHDSEQNLITLCSACHASIHRFFEVLEHLLRDQDVATEFFRVLRPGGALQLRCPHRLHPRHLAEVLHEPATRKKIIESYKSL